MDRQPGSRSRDSYNACSKFKNIFKNENDFSAFINKYNIQNKYKSIILNARYNTGLKYLTNDKSIIIVCWTSKHALNNIIKFKSSFISNILNNPYKYYNNKDKLLIYKLLLTLINNYIYVFYRILIQFIYYYYNFLCYHFLPNFH